MIHLGDITKIHGDQIEPVDCITFGSPCQDLSMAGLRAGLVGKNSGLFTEAIRVIVEMRVATNGMYPAFAIWENVPGAFSSNGGEDFRTVLEKLAHAAQPDVSIPRPAGGGRWGKAGAIIGNGWSLAWRLLNAERWGVPQRRKRIAVVADFRGQCAAEILFERTGLSGNPDKSIQTWQSVTGFTQNCPAGHDRVVAGEAAYTLKIRSGCAGGGKGALVQTEKTGTLSTLQDQTLFQPIVFDARGNGNGKTVPTITGDHESRVTDYTAIAVDLYNGAVTGSKAAALSCKNTGTTAGPQVAERKTYSEQTFSTYKESDSSATLKAKTGNIGNGGECLVAERVVRWIVRRLTPTECERLQGYPDGWTDIGEWTDTKGKKHKPADTPRYKALGNSIALPQWFWIAQKMRPYLKDKPTLGSLFDGIGGFPLVWETAYGAGTAVWASEIEEFPIAVTKRWFGNDTENESNSGAVLRG